MTAGEAVAADTEDRPPLPPTLGWLAVIAVALGIFTVMTSELLPVGLLTPVGTALEVSEGTAGLMVTAPGIVAGFAAPLLTASLGRLDRRAVLVALVALVALANLVSALAPNFAVLLVSRLLLGVSIGGFWAIAGGLALRLVPRERVAQATAVIFSGVAVASVLGVPSGTLLGELAGWRVAFGAVGALAMLVLGALLVLVPPLPVTRPTTLAQIAALPRANPGVLVGVVITFLLITGHFTAYTFLRPLLREVSGVPEGLISGLLLAYGLAGIAGNFLAGRAAARDVRRSLVAISLTLTAAITLTGVIGHVSVAGVALLVLWGLAYGGVSVSLQTWMLTTAPATPEAATSLFVTVFNWSIALGALLGGLALNTVSIASVVWIGAALVVLTAPALRLAPRATTQPEGV